MYSFVFCVDMKKSRLTVIGWKAQCFLRVIPVSLVIPPTAHWNAPNSVPLAISMQDADQLTKKWVDFYLKRLTAPLAFGQLHDKSKVSKVIFFKKESTFF